MDCGKVRKEILSFIYGELDRRDAGLVKDHIDACAECFEEWSAQKAVVAALDGWPDVDHRIDAASIISRARAEPRPRRAGLSRRALAALAAGIFIAVTLLFVGVEVQKIDGGVRLTFGRPTERLQGADPLLEQEIRTMVRRELVGGVGELIETLAHRFGEAALRQEQRQVMFARSAQRQREDDLRRTRGMIQRVALESAAETERTRHAVEGLVGLVRYADIKIPEIEEIRN